MLAQTSSTPRVSVDQAMKRCPLSTLTLSSTLMCAWGSVRQGNGPRKEQDGEQVLAYRTRK